jgi:hypothetical protein
MQIVQDDDLDHWACAGSSGTAFDRIHNVLNTIDYAGRKKLKSIHVLGVASSVFIPVLAWLGRYVDISSDASSAMKFASNYCVNELHGIKLSQSYIGNNFRTPGKVRTPHFHPKFMCSCGVCNALGSTELYQKIGTHGASSPHTEVLWIHNQSVYDEYTAGWNALAKSCTPKEYKEEYIRILSKSDRINAKIIDLIEDWTATNSKHACAKYKTYMLNTLGGQVLHTGDPKKFNLIEPDIVEPTRLKVLDAAAHRYLEFHGKKLAKYAKYLKG